ncbi:EamA family transporter [Demequina oxidasica]|uniref:EamA family transporter n=1 Tax=Demequina oxidasica TaxID=676199 RepID=UPI00136490C3|nr:DMT family transporter [Demequina oxidasica]
MTVPTPDAPARRLTSTARGAMYVITGAALFGINGSVAKVVIGAGVSPSQLTFFRVLSTVIIAGAVLLVTDRAQFRPTKRQLLNLAALGIGGLAMIQWLYAIAISILPVGVALLIEYTAVVFVALAAWLIFNERVQPRLWFAIGAVLVGLAIVAQVWDSSLALLGVLAAFGAAITYAFYFIMGERVVAAMAPMAVAFWASVFASAFWGLFSSWWTLDPATLTANVSLSGALESVVVPVWVPLLFVVTLGAFAPFVLIFSALGHLSATAVGILASSEVLFAFVVAWLWLGETLSTLQVGGATLVLVGIVIAQTARTRPGDDTVPDAEEAIVEVPPAVP